ncbi:HNH endonuclease [Aerococcaceae bacterium zg-ZJ1578]|uniref:HNH endonuclease signature motif containing protein n=1 Tax=Aerococcaceae bacterium zg-252 TaxID=2796928 RepID=UPI001A2FCD7A|nr:HNH endonuclease [Aerococcaceae bacterium zg-1578]
MPKGSRTRFAKPCSKIGCGILTHERFCEKHRKDTRPSAYERGYDSRWQKARKNYLIAHPFCVECQKDNRMTLATDVDHIIPHKGDKELFWDMDNWQPLCKACHSRKTAKFDMQSWY